MLKKALYVSISGNIVLFALWMLALSKCSKIDNPSLGHSAINKDVGVSQNCEIVMLGNSLTYGGNWNELLKRNNVKNSGYGGFTTQHFIWLLPEAVYKYKPKICLIEGGINDIGVGVPVGRIYRNLVAIADSLRSRRIIPVYQLTFHQYNTDQNDEVDSLNRMVRRYATAQKITVVDINPLLSENGELKKEFTTDGTHLTPAAYIIWAAEVNKLLSEYGL